MTRPSDPRVYLLDIMENIAMIKSFVADGVWDEKTRYAVERAFTIIAEAARRMPDDFKAQYADIPWAKINGLRNLIIHEYEAVNPMILQDIILNHLLLLENQLKVLLKTLNEQ